MIKSSYDHTSHAANDLKIKYYTLLERKRELQKITRIHTHSYKNHTIANRNGGETGKLKVRESLSGATFAGEIAEGKSGDGKSESVSVFYFLKNKKEKKKMKLKENDLCLKDNLISQIWLKISGFWRFN